MKYVYENFIKNKDKVLDKQKAFYRELAVKLGDTLPSKHLLRFLNLYAILTLRPSIRISNTFTS